MLHNAELRKDALLLAVLTGALTGLAALWDGPGWRTVLAGCVIISGIHFGTEYARYQRLKRLSLDLDRLLHDGTPLPIQAYQEGELSVLATQLQKMTLRLLESAKRAGADRAYLADSLADISHQLRTPLTAMNLTAAMLSSPALSAERRRELTVELRNLLGRTEWLVESLLKLSKLDAGTVTLAKEPVSLREVIRRAAQPLAVPMDLRDQRLLISCGEAGFTGDLVWTAEALGNILKNCMEHTPAGGTISVAGSESALYTAVIIEDTGPGLREEDIPHLFERFYRGADASDSSYGIGLALARTVIAAQNGTIQAMNGEHGARFEVRFYKTVI